MSRDWASTFVEIITSPISKITNVIDDIAGTPEHERFSNVAKRDVFRDSHLRNFDKISSDKELRVGNILRVPRDLYWHYGVYSGNDFVIHFTSEGGDTSSDNKVMETRTSKFIRDAGSIEVLAFPDEVNGKKVFTMEEVRSRARSQIGRGNYSVFNNNCQHFALWCKTGLAFSGQTVLVNGGQSDSYTASLLNTGVLLRTMLKNIKAPDLLSVHNISIGRVIFSSDYNPL